MTTGGWLGSPPHPGQERVAAAVGPDRQADRRRSVVPRAWMPLVSATTRVLPPTTAGAPALVARPADLSRSEMRSEPSAVSRSPALRHAIKGARRSRPAGAPDAGRHVERRRVLGDVVEEQPRLHGRVERVGWKNDWMSGSASAAPAEIDGHKGAVGAETTRHSRAGCDRPGRRARCGWCAGRASRRRGGISRVGVSPITASRASAVRPMISALQRAEGRDHVENCA